MKEHEEGGEEQRALLRHISSSLYFGNDNTSERERGGGRGERGNIDFQVCSACVATSCVCFPWRVCSLVRSEHRFGRIAREKLLKNWNVC